MCCVCTLKLVRKKGGIHAGSHILRAICTKEDLVENWCDTPICDYRKFKVKNVKQKFWKNILFKVLNF